MPINHTEVGGGPYLGGDGAAKQYGVAEVESRGVGEDAQPVPAVGRHAEGAVPLVEGEEERREVQRDENAHPHGPVEGPHEGSDGGRRVPTPNLGDYKKAALSSRAKSTAVRLYFHAITQILFSKYCLFGKKKYFCKLKRGRSGQKRDPIRTKRSGPARRQELAI